MPTTCPYWIPRPIVSKDATELISKEKWTRHGRAKHGNRILQAQWHRLRQPHFLWHAAFDPHGVASDRLGSPGRMENRVSFRVRGSIAHAKLETRLFYDGRSVETFLLPTTVLELASFGSEMTEPSLVGICRKQVRGTQLGPRQLP